MKLIKKNKKKTNIRRVNLGIEVLRMILSFLIVNVHFYDHTKAKFKLLLFPQYALRFYVPTFFIISFYFSFNTFISKNTIKKKERLLRILVPYFIWPFIFWIRFYYIHYKKDSQKFKKLYVHYLIGDGYLLVEVFWFQFNLIFITIFFNILILLFRKCYLICFKIIFIILCIYNFSGYNDKFFSNYYHPVYHSIKPIPYTLIYSLTGFFFGSFNLLEKSFKKRKIVIISVFPLFFLFKNYLKLLRINYHLEIFIIELVSSGTFINFSILPFDKIKNNKIIFLIRQITSYTGGIYFLHPEIYYIFENYLTDFKNKTQLGVLLNYLFCYFVCFLGTKIFGKTIFKNLFN